MRRYSILIAISLVILAALTAWGSGPMGRDTIGQPVDQFFPTSFGSVTITKASQSVSLTGAHAIRFKAGSDNTSVSINGVGTTWPLVTNTPETYYINPAVTSLVFSHASSAGATVYYQLHQ